MHLLVKYQTRLSRNNWNGILYVLQGVACLLILSSSLYAKYSIPQLEYDLHSWMAEKQVPGIAAAFFDGNEDHLLAIGFADVEAGQKMTVETFLEIGSITKVFTSTELALQVLKGRMNLMGSILLYMPALRHSPRFLQHITLLALATHTSSLPRIPPPMFRSSRRDVINFLQRWKPHVPIGTHYAYSNLGYGMIGYAIENLRGKSFFQVIKEDILNPLEMNATFISVPKALDPLYAKGYNQNRFPAHRWKVNPWPAGGALRSTASDMLKFLKANLNIEGPAQLREAMQMAQKGYYKANAHLTMGLGWQLVYKDGMKIVDKNGGVTGFSAYIGMLPEKRIGIVLLVNKGRTRITQMGRQLLVSIAQED